MATAMILAAGLGTRMRPLTDEIPKPLAPVGDRPMIAHVAERLVAGGIDRAVIDVHHHADAFTSGLLARLPIALEVVREPVLLGTGGGVANARARLGDGDVLVWNGDILADIDVTALLAAHTRDEDLALATLAFAPRSSGEGTLGIGANGAVVRLRGERFGEELRGGDFLGIQVIGPALRFTLPIPGCLVADGYLPALRRGARIAALAAPGAWDDIGSVGSYLAANARWLARSGLPHFIAPNARVEAGIDLSGSVIGEGAIVIGSGALERCVVWPGARVEAPLADAVATPRGIVTAERTSRS